MCATTMQPRPAIMSTGARDWYLKSSENPSIVFPIPRRRCPPFVAEPVAWEVVENSIWGRHDKK